MVALSLAGGQRLGRSGAFGLDRSETALQAGGAPAGAGETTAIDLPTDQEERFNPTAAGRGTALDNKPGAFPAKATAIAKALARFPDPAARGGRWPAGFSCPSRMPTTGRHLPGSMMRDTWLYDERVQDPKRRSLRRPRSLVPRRPQRCQRRVRRAAAVPTSSDYRKRRLSNNQIGIQRRPAHWNGV